MNAWKVVTVFLIVAVLILGWDLIGRSLDDTADNSVFDSTLSEPDKEHDPSEPEKERDPLEPVAPSEHRPDSNGLLWWLVEYAGGKGDGWTVYPTSADKPKEGMGSIQEELDNLRWRMRQSGELVIRIKPINKD